MNEMKKKLVDIINGMGINDKIQKILDEEEDKDNE